MEIYQDIESLPHFPLPVITIGTFDGVHLGHLQIIRQLAEAANSIGGTSIVITFYPHPKQVIGISTQPLYTLNTLEEKALLLKKAGVQKLVVVPFNIQFSEQSAIDYISDFLVKRFNPHTIIIGYDHRFGKDRLGDYHLLQQCSQQYGYNLIEIPEHILKNITISSTEIRKALLEGNIQKANSFLGYDYFMKGKVVEGNKLGRTIGFPTANISIEDENKLIPSMGVYAVYIRIAKNPVLWKGMMNIGMRPTVGGKHRVIEVHIFEFNQIIYGEDVTIHFKEKIREEKSFDGLAALQLQLVSDKKFALHILEDKS